MSTSVVSEDAPVDSADKKLLNAKEHSEAINGLPEGAKLNTDIKALNDGFISDISSEPFIDSENASLASCEGSTTGETLSFKGNFRKDSSTTFKKTFEEDKDKPSTQEFVESEIEHPRGEESEESLTIKDALENNDEEMEEAGDFSQKNGSEEPEDLCSGEPTTENAEVVDEADEVSQNNESPQDVADSLNNMNDENEHLDNDSISNVKEVGNDHVGPSFKHNKKVDLKLRKKVGKSDRPMEKQSASGALIPKKRKKKKKKGISLPVLEVGELMEKWEISDEGKERNRKEDRPSLSDKEAETAKQSSEQDVASRDEREDPKDPMEDGPLLLDKGTETEGSDHGIADQKETDDSEEQTEDSPVLLDKETEIEKQGSYQDVSDQEECEEPEDPTVELTDASDKENLGSYKDVCDREESKDLEDPTVELLVSSEKEKLASDQVISDPDERKVPEDSTEDLPILSEKEIQSSEYEERKDSEENIEDVPSSLDKNTDKEKLSSDHDSSDRKEERENSEDVPGVSEKETQKAKLISDHVIAGNKTSDDNKPLMKRKTKKNVKDSEDSDDDVPLIHIKRKTENVKGGEDSDDDKPLMKRKTQTVQGSEDSDDDMPLIKHKTQNLLKRRAKNKRARNPPLPNGDLGESDDYENGKCSQKRICQTVSNCFVNLRRLTDKECKEANIASVGFTIRHPTFRQCYVRLQHLTQACSAIEQSKCFVRLSRLPSSMIPAFGNLAFESDMQIHLDVGPVTRTVGKNDESHTGRPVRRTIVAKRSRGRPTSAPHTLRPKRQKRRMLTSR